MREKCAKCVFGAAVKPYYSEDGITIYHGDCREILPTLGPADVVVTDPPWPNRSGHPDLVVGNGRAHELWAETAPLLRARRVLVWLSIDHDPRPFLSPIALPFLRLVYIRRAIPGYAGRVLRDGEAIYALGEWPPARKGRMVIPGGTELPAGLSITYRARDRVNDHPAPRSEIATRWLLSWWSDDGETISDPFMGSGTTLCAAKALGRRAIGIEIEERYCEIAAKRLSQEVLPLEPA